MQLDEKKLEEKCWDIVSKKTEECLNSEAFCNIELRTLNTLLRKRSLQITEVDLFKAVLKDKECARQDINIEDKTSRRCVLGDSVYDIDFLEMSLEDFTKYVSSTGILTDVEVISIFQHFGGSDATGLKWKKERKKKCHIVSLSRSDVTNTVQDLGCGWCYDGRCSDALTLSVNKAVLFHGVRLFGSSNGSQYKVEFTIKNENVTGTYTSGKDNDGVWGYDVMLPEPISLQRDEEFTIMATIKGRNSCYGKNGKLYTTVNDIAVTFKNATNRTIYRTDKNEGQFYKIFLSNL